MVWLVDGWTLLLMDKLISALIGWLTDSQTDSLFDWMNLLGDWWIQSPLLVIYCRNKVAFSVFLCCILSERGSTATDHLKLLWFFTCSDNKLLYHSLHEISAHYRKKQEKGTIFSMKGESWDQFKKALRQIWKCNWHKLIDWLADVKLNS